jgi:hypothetical protein
MEETLIKNIENGIRSIRLGTEPKEVKVGYSLNKLKFVNEGMYEHYMEKYKEVLAEYKNKQK